jgi:hypothetical protein
MCCKLEKKFSIKTQDFVNPFPLRDQGLGRALPIQGNAKRQSPADGNKNKRELNPFIETCPAQT